MRLQPSTLRNRSPLLPGHTHRGRTNGEILRAIFPSTPPQLLAAANRVSEMPTSLAAVTCNAPSNAFDDVSDPVTATPSQPIRAEKNATVPPPAPAAQRPSGVIVCPDWFIT